jgi:hypothetical protein
MTIEYAQLMSTAHRVLDGTKVYELQNNRRIARYHILNEDPRQLILYKASHVNHPSNIWARSHIDNYTWLYNMWVCLANEFTRRSKENKIHATYIKLHEILKTPPNNINKEPIEWIDPPQTMFDDVKHEDTITAYRQFYKVHKSKFASWPDNEVPSWMI